MCNVREWVAGKTCVVPLLSWAISAGTGMGDQSGVQLPVPETYLSIYNQLARLTQPGHPSVGRRNEYQPKDSDAVRLGSKGRYGS